MTLTNDLAEWVRYMRASNNTVDTIAQRRYHVLRVFREMKLDHREVTTEQLVSWLGSQQWKANTIRSYRGSLRAFFAWVSISGRRADNPALMMPKVKARRGVPRPTPDLIYRAGLLNADERVRLMIHLAAICGLRRGEIARARRVLIEDLEGWSLHVRGKGDHERYVPLPPELAATIRAMPEGWLFPSPSQPSHLTPAHVGKLVARTLTAGWTCHTLRHRCGTIAYADKKDLRAVQELLGHASPDTTAIYTFVPPASIRAAMNAAAA